MRQNFGPDFRSKGMGAALSGAEGRLQQYTVAEGKRRCGSERAGERER